jgi:hypothetical protein
MLNRMFAFVRLRASRRFGGTPAKQTVNASALLIGSALFLSFEYRRNRDADHWPMSSRTEVLPHTRP